MAIEKNSFKASRFDSEFSGRSKESMSSEDDEFQRRNSEIIESEDDDDDLDDCDSGAGSDDFDLLELGEAGEEFCQVEDQTCCIPVELFDITGLNDVFSMDVWNDVLTEEERFNLTKYLPDMDQETFMQTMNELFRCSNFHFGCPINKLFDMLKGGLCEPRVALYRQGLNTFQKRRHYHLLWKYQNSMVTNLCQMRDAWLNCRGYSIDEKLRVLNIMKSQKSLMYENMEELESESSEREDSGDILWKRKPKDRKIAPKTGHYASYGEGLTMDFPQQGMQMALKPVQYKKQNAKGTLKVAGPKVSSTKEVEGRFPTVQHGIEMKLGPYSPALSFPRQNKVSGYDSMGAVRMRDQITGDDDVEETIYGVAVQKEQNFLRSTIDKGGTAKRRKKHDGLRGDTYTDSFFGFPVSLKGDLHTYARNNTVNQLSDIKVLTTKPSSTRVSYEHGKKMKHSDKFQQFSVEEQTKHGKGRLSKASRLDLSGGADSVDSSLRYGDWNVNDRLFHSEYRGKLSQEKASVGFIQKGGRDMQSMKAGRMFARSEETESDSSEQIEEDDDDNPLMRSKWAYPSGVKLKSGLNSKKAKTFKKNKRDKLQALDGLSHSRKMSDFGESQNYSSKAKQKNIMHDFNHLNVSASKGLEESYFYEPGEPNNENDQKQMHKLRRKVQLQGENGGRFDIPILKAYPMEGRQRGGVNRDYSSPQYMHDYVVEEDSRARRFVGEDAVTTKIGKKGRVMEAYIDDHHERSDIRLVGCDSVTKKWKTKDNETYMNDKDDNDYLNSNIHKRFEDIPSLKKRGKRKLEADTNALEKEALEPPGTELLVEDLELEAKQQKKPFTLIIPTVHTGFSFSVIHLLSAVRIAMVTVLPEDSLEVGKHFAKNDGRERLSGEEQARKQEGANGFHSYESLDTKSSGHSGQANAPSLTVQEIVNRVRSNPGDPCILETKEPLQDLVRGVLKIFSSRTAPLGAKGWKPLVLYEKHTKSWSWIGPLSHSLSNQEAIEEVTSPESWALPHKMIVKLVDSFANWLKSGQDTLQQIGSLPAPPLTLMQFNLDEKERFKDLRAQKSLTTISPSSEELRAYFRMEEVLRYSIPDRAFSYTAIDGKKSIVAPLRRCGGKPTSKARDHFMLKRDRPPHVTILCLVRDAAARLPGSIGTRADVCTLIRDSQYIVEDVSDAQVNQVVSGALDRLHYERDPCVQFDGERKLWVYLHREREEEDFEDDGTSSTKKWKRQKKEAAEPFEQGTVTVAYHSTGEQTGFDLSSDLNVEPSCTDDDKRMNLEYCGERNPMEDNVVTSHRVEQSALRQGPLPRKDAFGLNSTRGSKLLCQENSTIEDFDDETFSRDPPAEFLGTSLL